MPPRARAPSLTAIMRPLSGRSGGYLGILENTQPMFHFRFNAANTGRGGVIKSEIGAPISMVYDSQIALLVIY